MAALITGVTIICVTSLFFVFVFGIFAYMRYLKHKEILAMTEKGLMPQEMATHGANLDNGPVRWAIMLIVVGMALCIGLYPIGWLAMPGELPLNIGPWMLVGLLPMFLGLGLLIIHFLPTLQVLISQEWGATGKSSAHASSPAPAQKPAAAILEDSRGDAP